MQSDNSYHNSGSAYLGGISFNTGGSALAPILTNMENFYEFASGALETDTQGNDDLTNSGVTYFSDSIQDDTGSFDGTDSMTGIPSIAAASAGSWSCTFSTTDVTSVQALFGWVSTVTPSIHIASSTTIAVRGAINPIKTFTLPITLVNDTFYNLMVTKSTSNSANLYINGTISTSGALTLVGDANFTDLGARMNANLFLTGKITRVRRWLQENTAADAITVSNADLFT